MSDYAQQMQHYGGRAGAADTHGQVVDFECTIEDGTPVVRIILDGGFKVIAIPSASFAEVLVELCEWLGTDLPERMMHRHSRGCDETAR